MQTLLPPNLHIAPLAAIYEDDNPSWLRELLHGLNDSYHREGNHIPDRLPVTMGTPWPRTFLQSTSYDRLDLQTRDILDVYPTGLIYIPALEKYGDPANSYCLNENLPALISVIQKYLKEKEQAEKEGQIEYRTGKIIIGYSDSISPEIELFLERCFQQEDNDQIRELFKSWHKPISAISEELADLFYLKCEIYDDTYRKLTEIADAA